MISIQYDAIPTLKEIEIEFYRFPKKNSLQNVDTVTKCDLFKIYVFYSKRFCFGEMRI